MSVASKTFYVHNESMKDEALIQFKLMLPAELKKRVETHANINRRSLSQEIVTALEKTYPVVAAEPPTDPAARKLYWLAKRIRGRNPKPGSARDKQAALYERIADDIVARMNDIGTDD